MKKEIESNTLDVIKECIEEKETTKSALARELDVSRQALNGRLNRKDNLSIGTILEILNQLGYSVYVVPDGEEVVNGKKIDIKIKKNKEQ